jgi:hypothetical protein
VQGGYIIENTYRIEIEFNNVALHFHGINRNVEKPKSTKAQLACPRFGGLTPMTPIGKLVFNKSNLTTTSEKRLVLFSHAVCTDITWFLYEE